MEKHFTFESQDCQLVATLHLPDGGEPAPVGLLLLHGWAGYRIGAHQMFVKLARAAAERGYACLRFDFRGRGDSEGDANATTLSTMIADTKVAAEVVLREAGVSRVVLVGDCSGSEVAIGSAAQIETVTAMVLWSAPIVGADRQATDSAKKRDILRQYAVKLFRRETWAKLLSGNLQGGMIKRALIRGGKGTGEEGSQSDKDIDWIGRFTRFSGDVLFIYGSKDPTAADAAAHFQSLTGDAARHWHLHLVEGANHAFYSVAWEDEVIAATLDWIAERCPVRTGP